MIKNSMGIGTIEAHDVSPPMRKNMLDTVISGFKPALLALAATGYASTAHAGENKSESNFSGAASIYTQSLYPNGTIKSDNPGVKVEGKWELGEGFYAGANATKSLSDDGEGEYNFGNTLGIKGGYKTKIADVKVNTWLAAVDTEKGGFGDVNFAKASIEASKGIFSANGYVASVEGKYGEWSDGYGIGGDIELVNYIPTDAIDSLRIGGETGVEEKKGYDFTELHIEVSKKILDRTYAIIKYDRQLQGSLEGDNNIRFELKTKF